MADQPLTYTVVDATPHVVLVNAPQSAELWQLSDDVTPDVFDVWTPLERAVWAARLRGLADVIDSAGQP